MDTATRAATLRLLKIASYDTNQAERVADFLLSWWNARSCGGFNPIYLASFDEKISDDIMIILGTLARGPVMYPEEFETEFRQLVAERRPHLVKKDAIPA